MSGASYPAPGAIFQPENGCKDGQILRGRTTKGYNRRPGNWLASPPLSFDSSIFCRVTPYRRPICNSSHISGSCVRFQLAGRYCRGAPSCRWWGRACRHTCGGRCKGYGKYVDFPTFKLVFRTNHTFSSRQLTLSFSTASLINLCRLLKDDLPVFISRI